MIDELILLRHGESRHLVEDLTGGWTDTHLTERGISQARALADRLQDLLDGKSFTLFSSDLHRASETAEVISKQFKKKILFLENLRELNNGVGANLTNDDARKIMNPLIEPFEDWIPFEDGESWRMLYDRAAEVLQQIRTIEKERAVIVSHGNTIRCMISSWLGISLDDRITYELHTCSITWLRVNRLGQRTIRKLNDCSHLLKYNLEDLYNLH
jgi:probable phosphoglycerate mutase